MRPPQLNFWPFKRAPRKAPPLHRALENSSRTADGVHGNNTDESNLLLVEELASKRRVKKKDSFQRNALHVACMHQPQIETVMLLIDVYPKAVRQPDKVGRLPLHTACANQASLEVVDYLWRQDHETVYEVTDRGVTPLYCAIENKASLDVIEFLVEKDPEAMTATQYKLGKTPVHAAVARGQSLEVIQYLLRKRPQALEEEDAWGKTPLACVAASSAHYDDPDECAAVFDFLIDPTRIQQCDRAGMLPLHIACANSASVENIQALLDEYPEAIRCPDNNGRLPLHAACTNPRVELELLELLVQEYPEALKTFDKMGAVPLHLSIQRKLPADAVLFLIEQAEGAVRTREAATMMYPLHLACKAGSEMEIMETLLDIYPRAIDAVDNKGNTIFHVACMARTLTPEFCEMLLDYCSYETIQEANEDGSLPLHLAVQNRASMPVLQLLIDYYPEALDIKDEKGNTPMHKAFQTTTEMHVLVRLAQQNPHALNRRNKKGQKPLDIASVALEKRFIRARRWYNIRMAYCPCCIRMKFVSHGPETVSFERKASSRKV